MADNEPVSEFGAPQHWPAWTRCYTCRDYTSHRRGALAEPLANKAMREVRGVVEVVNEFMGAAHDRHVTTGEPLRDGGPTRLTDPRIGRLAALLSPGLFEGEVDDRG